MRPNNFRYKYIHNTNERKYQILTDLTVRVEFDMTHFETLFEQFIAVFSGNIWVLVTFLK